MGVGVSILECGKVCTLSIGQIEYLCSDLGALRLFLSVGCLAFCGHGLCRGFFLPLTLTRFIGSRFGRTRIFKSISARKTLEGVFGGIALSIIGILITRWAVAHYLSIAQCVILAVGASVIGQVGDLVESMIKRDVKIKDASSTIPGHGGVLDRFDSLLFTAPLIYYYFKYFILS